ncbi:MAG: hypothetical protein AB7O45_00980, partial [Alphaproteobacteria bacterium]
PRAVSRRKALARLGLASGVAYAGMTVTRIETKALMTPPTPGPPGQIPAPGGGCMPGGPAPPP